MLEQLYFTMEVLWKYFDETIVRAIQLAQFIQLSFFQKFLLQLPVSVKLPFFV